MNYDLDVLAATQELNRRGATSIVAGGGVLVSAGAVLAALKIAGLAGLVLVTPVQVLPAMKRDDARLVEPVDRCRAGDRPTRGVAGVPAEAPPGGHREP